MTIALASMVALARQDAPAEAKPQAAESPNPPDAPAPEGQAPDAQPTQPAPETQPQSAPSDETSPDARYVEPVLAEYVLDLVEATRKHPEVTLGASTRAGLALYRATQALALVEGRDFAVPDDVKRLAASLEVASRGNGFARKDRRAIVQAAAAGYRQAMRRLAVKAAADTDLKAQSTCGSAQNTNGTAISAAV